MRQRLEFLIAGGAVKRFHALEVNRPPTDAEHSWGVAMLCYILAGEHPSANLLLAALTHDIAEHETGDVPSHVKRYGNIGIQLEAIEAVHRRAQGLDFAPRLTPEEARVLDFADQLEGMLYCIRERRLGNRNVIQPYERWAQWISEQNEIPRLTEICTAIGSMWREANEHS